MRANGAKTLDIDQAVRIEGARRVAAEVRVMTPALEASIAEATVSGEGRLKVSP